ncbi:Golgi apparatus 1-like, partial [Paramuricea clavata]
MTSKYFERSRFVAVFVVFSQLMLSESVSLNGTNLRNVEALMNKNINKGLSWADPTKPRVVLKGKDQEGMTYKLTHDERCREDIEDYCAQESRKAGNYDLLLCLQNQIKEDELSDECHQAIWEYKTKLVHNPVFEAPVIDICRDDWQKIDECKAIQPNTGDLVLCLVGNKDGIQNARCKHIVNKLAQIVFTDYRLLKNFYKDCTADVKKFQCSMEEG